MTKKGFEKALTLTQLLENIFSTTARGEKSATFFVTFLIFIQDGENLCLFSKRVRDKNLD